MGKISVIAIERQYCSGGSEIGKLVAAVDELVDKYEHSRK